MNYKNLVNAFQALEVNCLKDLSITVPTNPDPCMCNNQAQFFSVEKVPNSATTDDNLPVIVCVGANFSQSTNHNHQWTTGYVYTETKGQSEVEDYPPFLNPPIRPAAGRLAPVAKNSPMSRELNKYLNIYDKCRNAFHDRKLASCLNIDMPQQIIIPQPKPYILVATNLCPFITFYEWQQYTAAERANLLWIGKGAFDHLDKMIRLLRSLNCSPSLWVGHGLGSEEFVLFRQWQTINKLNPWLLLHKLGTRPYYSKSPYWMKPRNCGPLKLAQFAVTKNQGGK